MSAFVTRTIIGLGMIYMSWRETHGIWTSIIFFLIMVSLEMTAVVTQRMEKSLKSISKRLENSLLTKASHIAIRTGAGLDHCLRAVAEAGGNEDLATDIIRSRGRA